jgi:thiol reductant ABC exporter CydC subunit
MDKWLKQFLAPEWPRLLTATLAGIITVAANIGLMGSSAYLISLAALQPPLAALSLSITAVRFFGITRAILRYLDRLWGHAASLEMLGRMQIWFYRTVEPLVPARLDNYHTGDLWQRMAGDIDAIKFYFLRVLQPPLTAVIVLTGVGVFLSFFHISLAFVLTVGFIAASLIIPLAFQHKKTKLAAEAAEMKAEISVELTDTLRGMEEIIAYGNCAYRKKRFDALINKSRNLELRQTHCQGLLEACSTAAGNITVWGILLVTAYLVQNRQIEGIFLAVMPLIAQSSFEAAWPMLQVFHYHDGMKAAAKRLLSIGAKQGDCPDPSQPAVLSGNYDLAVEDLSFGYSHHSARALSGLSFRVKQGGRLAIVGPSGAGKSTLAAILLRFRDYQEGRVSIGGEDIKKFKQEDIRGLFGVVAQDTYLFHASIRDNILLANPNASEKEIWQVLADVRLTETVLALPQGLDTIVGSGGKLLSGGERQRLAIARALVKNAPILLFDEPTASLDAITECEIMTVLDRLDCSRSVIFITHRLTGLQAMDEIIVMDQGAIVERGTFAELLQRQGMFRHMWRLQRDVLPDEMAGSSL